MHHLTANLLAVLAEIDEDTLQYAYNLRRADIDPDDEDISPFDRAVYAWRDAGRPDAPTSSPPDRWVILHVPGRQTYAGRLTDLGHGLFRLDIPDVEVPAWRQIPAHTIPAWSFTFGPSAVFQTATAAAWEAWAYACGDSYSNRLIGSTEW